MRPLLLRSAGVVGLAGLIMAVVSNERLFIESEEAEPVQAARLQVPNEIIEPRTVAAISVRDTTAYSNLVPGVFAPPPGARSEPKAPEVPAASAPEQTVALAPLSTAPTPPAAEPDALVPVELATPSTRQNVDKTTSAASAPDQTAALAPPSTAPTPPAAEPDAVVPVEPATTLSTRQNVEETTSAAPGAECPGNWIALEGEEPLPTQCDEAAPLIDLAALPDKQRALEDAALERAAEIAGLQFAPRIPQVRPEPPPVTKKASRIRKTALAKWPADPPPKCGSDKRAKWRYVNRVPTWYCR